MVGSTTTASPQEPSKVDPPVTTQDRSCAIFVRAALFPWKVDWHGKGRHHAIHPALTALDRLRKDLVDKRQTPFSTLFPRGVLLVPSPSAPGEMQWNGQPNMKNGNHVDAAVVEVIPNALSVRCMECMAGVVPGDVKAYFRIKQTVGTSGRPIQEQELVVCSNRVLQRDYHKQFDGKDSQTLLEERRDLPAQSMSAVEEVLAREIAKLQVATTTGSRDDTEPKLQTQSPSMSCPEYAGMELLVAKVAECMYETKGNEVRKGSALRPAVGFSWLPTLVQRDFQNRCVKNVALQYTARQYGGDKAKAKACVNDAWKTMATSKTQ